MNSRNPFPGVLLVQIFQSRALGYFKIILKCQMKSLKGTVLTGGWCGVHACVRGGGQREREREGGRISFLDDSMSNQLPPPNFN